MALVQMLKFAGASTFGEMAAKYFEVVTSYFRQGCHRVDLVFDQYWQLSIKAGEQKKRGEANAFEVRIHGASTPVSKQFPKYIAYAQNKVSLCAFLRGLECNGKTASAAKQPVCHWRNDGRKPSIIHQEHSM